MQQPPHAESPFTTLLIRVCFTAALVLPVAANATILLNFDEVALGTVLNDHYEAMGVTLTGIGNGGPFDVIADEPCVGSASSPHALSHRPLEECPEINNQTGWFRVDFELPQPRVSIMATAEGPASLVYLKAYGETSLLDQKQAIPTTGVPELLEISRDPKEQQILYVEFGALSGSNKSNFDDLSYEIRPVATAASSWSAVKARFDR